MGDKHRQEAASEPLRRSEQNFRLLVESVREYAIFMLDPRGQVESWNVGAHRLKGYHEHEILGEHYSIFYPPQQRAAGLPDRLLTTARQEGQATHRGWRIRKDGSKFWADVVITSLFDHEGQLVGFAKVTRDNTDQHRAEQAREQALRDQARAVEQLEELDRWRVDFVRGIAHDLESPLVAITGFAQLLLDDTDTDGEARQWLGHIHSNAGALREMIDNLRSHAPLTEPVARLEIVDVDLAEHIHQLVADMAPVVENRPVHVEVADTTVRADPAALNRVLRNLLTNAARHTPSATPLEVAARPEVSQVVIEVTDHGPGIPPELLPTVFERFARGATGGTGLGLAIAKEYVERQGGTISAHSSPGQGTTIRFTLPLNDHGLTDKQTRQNDTPT